MPKGRIGLSLSEDVLAILNNRGRNENAYHQCNGVESADAESTQNKCTVCGEYRSGPSDSRPTRTQIIEMLIREWDARLIAQSNGGARERATALPDDNTNSLSPESAQKRAENAADEGRLVGVHRRQQRRIERRDPALVTKADDTVRPHSFHSGSSPIPGCDECAALAEQEEMKPSNYGKGRTKY